MNTTEETAVKRTTAKLADAETFPVYWEWEDEKSIVTVQHGTTVYRNK